MDLVLREREKIVRRVVAPLLEWYDGSARILPWRESVDPYRVWVSEIMLQQTRVEAVKPFYERFLRVLPTLADLARIPEEPLLKLWEGLGYYNRVRNLQKAAVILVEQYGGVFPSSRAELRKLPGIGEYTAGAVASICFGLPEPAIDGNVLRVFARLFADNREIACPAVRRELAELLKPAYPSGRCGDFTQSLMELGALVCLPGKAARCELCPLVGICLAHRRNLVDKLPEKSVKKARRLEDITVFLLRCGGRVAVRKREECGVLAGMWALPGLAGVLTEKSALAALHEWGLEAVRLQRAGATRHVFTHIEWAITVYCADCREEKAPFRWVTTAELKGEISLPTAFRKLLPFLDGLPLADCVKGARGKMETPSASGKG